MYNQIVLFKCFKIKTYILFYSPTNSKVTFEFLKVKLQMTTTLNPTALTCFLHFFSFHRSSKQHLPFHLPTLHCNLCLV